MLPSAGAGNTSRVLRVIGSWCLLALAVALLSGIALDHSPDRALRVHLLSRDIDGDRDLDLLVTTPGGGRFVWLNDGAGRYSQGSVSNYPDWVWHPLPELAPQLALADNNTELVATNDDLPALGPAAAPACAFIPLSSTAPAAPRRSPWRVPLHDTIRPPPSASLA